MAPRLGDGAGIYIYIPRCDPWGVLPIYLHNWIWVVLGGPNVGKYTSPIEHLGYIYIDISLRRESQKESDSDRLLANPSRIERVDSYPFRS